MYNEFWGAQQDPVLAVAWTSDRNFCLQRDCPVALDAVIDPMLPSKKLSLECDYLGCPGGSRFMMVNDRRQDVEIL